MVIYITLHIECNVFYCTLDVILNPEHTLRPALWSRSGLDLLTGLTGLSGGQSSRFQAILGAYCLSGAILGAIDTRVKANMQTHTIQINTSAFMRLRFDGKI